MRVRATSIALAAVLVAGLTGCTFTAVQGTRQAYDPSDGVGATIGDVQVQNALLISDNGTTGNLLVNVVNSGTENVSLKVSWKGSTGWVGRNVYVKAGGAQTYGKKSNQILITGITTNPGGLFPVYVQYGAFDGKELAVPVLDGTLPEYTDYVPAK